MVNARAKGQRGEREVIEEIYKVFGVKYARTPLSGGMDIKGDIRRPYKGKKTICDLFHWEVKFNEHLSVWEAFKQAERDALKDPLNPVPIVVFRRKNTQWRTIINLDMFLELLLELQAYRTSAIKGADGLVDTPSTSDGSNLSHLLSPIGSLPENINKQDYKGWIEEKDQQQEAKKAKRAKMKLLKEKYGSK